ncbi:MAG: crossover junction endodeoxyribonuclease RuvC [Gemmatales bacterium]|nr:crossover junction endodeoxyribonuclease RuvC [Gemmatales bacterium]MCS7161106.1 crossover junction endodeoxyribonuclease RuvC [Gemmatales bacterium]MDW8176309.1 crossover junction endodeoxyribonuclease RuvC [Gemmatales bacterium]MDW8221750.1 crossover junction endodeoxyribonuclease RuvC [Gemmatales bacterium]
MRILGIDPGLQVTGYGLIAYVASNWQLTEAGVIRPEGRNLPERLAELWHGLEELLRETCPDVLAIEELYSHYAHPRTAVLMAHARGVILTASARMGIPVVSYAATRIKKTIAGSGHASKEQMQRVIQAELGLAQLPEPADVADALACALCHAFVQRSRPQGKR